MFFKLLTILFIGLKLTHFISWSWWLVLLPLYFWIIAAIFVILMGTGVSIWKKK